ncbi:MAG: TIGR02147 family protein, partial [Bdellovibrionota bacterium]
MTRTTLSVKQAPMSVTQNITRPSSVKAWLAGELESRCQRNPKYSLRAFARDLAISAPRLSRVLSGTEGISRSAATSLGKRLGLSKEETTHLCYLAESQFARSRIRRAQARKLIELRAGADSNLQLDAFKIVSDWYHFALLELTLTTGFQNDPDWMARQLGISIHEVRGALERLKRLDALTETEGHFCANRDFVVNAAGIPSEAVR